MNVNSWNRDNGNAHAIPLIVPRDSCSHLSSGRWDACLSRLQDLFLELLEVSKGKAMPLGNLTSQVFANIYLNELDQFVKHKLKMHYCIRYADDFLFLSKDKELLCKYVNALRQFLSSELKFELHPDKIIFRKLEWGVDFLGYVVLPYHILPRTKTKRRIFKKLREKIGLENFNQSMQSYLGYLGHTNSFKIAQELKNQVWL